MDNKDFGFILQASKLVETEISKPENIVTILNNFGKNVLPYRKFLLYPLSDYKNEVETYKNTIKSFELSNYISVLGIEIFDEIHHFALWCKDNEIEIFDPLIEGSQYSTYTLNIIQLVRDVFQPSQIKINLLPDNFRFQSVENIYIEGQERHYSCLWSIFYLHCKAYKIDLAELSEYIKHLDISSLFLIKRYAISLCNYFNISCINTSLYKTYYSKIALKGDKYKCLRLHSTHICHSVMDIVHYTLVPLKYKVIGKSKVPDEIKLIQNRKRKRYYEA